MKTTSFLVFFLGYNLFLLGFFVVPLTIQTQQQRNLLFVDSDFSPVAGLGWRISRPFILNAGESVRVETTVSAFNSTTGYPVSTGAEDGAIRPVSELGKQSPKDLQLSYDRSGFPFYPVTIASSYVLVQDLRYAASALGSPCGNQQSQPSQPALDCLRLNSAINVTEVSFGPSPLSAHSVEQVPWIILGIALMVLPSIVRALERRRRAGLSEDDQLAPRTHTPSPGH